MLRGIAFALALIAAPAVAVAAQDRSQEQVDALLRCIDVSSVEERVQCYDRNAVALRESLRSGEVAITSGAERRERAPTPSRIDAAVTASSATANGGWRIELDNGQVWETSGPQSQGPPPVGSQARIRRNLIGSVFLFVRGRPEARVSRVE